MNQTCGHRPQLWLDVCSDRLFHPVCTLRLLGTAGDHTQCIDGMESSFPVQSSPTTMIAITDHQTDPALLRPLLSHTRPSSNYHHLHKSDALKLVPLAYECFLCYTGSSQRIHPCPSPDSPDSSSHYTPLHELISSAAASAGRFRSI